MNQIDIKSQTAELIRENIYKIVSFYTTIESTREWDLKSIVEDIQGLIGNTIDFNSTLENIRDQEGSIETKKQAIIDTLVQTVEGILAKRFESVTDDQYQGVLSSVYIQTIDNLWMEHLEVIDYLKTGIRLRGYAQRDPLIEYKNEAFMLFEKLLTSIRDNYINTILRIEPTPQIAQNIIAPNPMGESLPRVGRNDLCPCGSGKKYKKCHGK